MNFEDLRDDYLLRWGGLEVLPDKRPDMERAAAKIVAGRRHYEAISAATGVPWYFIGLLHMRESYCNFSTHLHNGDPLAPTKRSPSGRTYHEPPNRPPWKPRNGSAYTFEESCEDALKMKGLHLIKDWSINRMLYEAERYNGMGYRIRGHSQVSPYVFAGSNQQKDGKYVEDGRYDPSHWDVQPGIATVLKVMLEKDPYLMVTPPEEAEAVAAPKADYKPETHQEAHALLNTDDQSYSLVANILKGLGLPATLVGGAATAGAENGLQAYAPFISFFKEYGFRLAIGLVAIIVVAEVIQYVRRVRAQT